MHPLCKIGLPPTVALVCLTALVALVAPPAQAQTPAYTLTILGTLGRGADSTSCYGVNNKGQVVGISTLADGSTSHAIISDPNGGAIHDLGALGGVYSEASGINSAGQVAGFYSLADNVSHHAFLSDPNGGALHDLGTLGGADSDAGGVNDVGQAGGWSTLAGDRVRHAFFYSPDGGMHDLGTLGGPASEGGGINSRGQVTGEANTATGGPHAFLSDPNGGALHDLGTLGGTRSSGGAVNGAGQVVGDSYTASGDDHAFLSDPNGGALHDLGVLGADFESYSVAYSINKAGQVVGASSISLPGTHAFLWTPSATGGQMLDLNSLIPPGSGFTLCQAYSISDTGFITGYAADAAGDYWAFFLTPGPPSLASVAFPPSVPGGTVVTATVALSGPAPSDTVVGLSGSDSSVVRLHRAVVVPAGSQSATFTVNTYRSQATKTVTIQASLNGTAKTLGLTITAAP